MELQGVFINVRHVTTVGRIKTIPHPAESTFTVDFVSGKEFIARFTILAEASQARNELVHLVTQTRA